MTKSTSMQNHITMGDDGYFRRGAELVLPVGVNYWPGTCGVDMWQSWPETEMQHDLDVVRDLGLNCVRFFLRWPDFEPELGRYNEAMFGRLAQFMGWCAERDLLAHPALIVGFMSGGHFWPKGKDSRSLYADPLMVERSTALARKAAAVAAPFSRHLLAFDLGNELGCADAWTSPPAAIRDWCGAMAAAIREGCPGALVVSGTDSGVVTVDYGWRLGAQPGMDFYSVHTYPVPAWNVVPFDGMTDPLCQAILPFCTRLARAFGPVMVQEFSTILMMGQAACESYLKAVVPACLAGGSNGFLWWCLRDIRANVHPYPKHGFEGRLGLVDDNDRVKPALAGVLAFLQSLGTWTPPAPRNPPLAIYWPEHYYRRDNDRNPGNDPSPLFRRMLAAYHLMTLAGHEVGVARGDRPFDPALETLVITGAALTTGEMERLESWVRDGGRVLWCGPSWPQWTPSADAMIGAQPADIRFPKPATVACFGGTWTLSNSPSDGRVAVRMTTARVLAADGDGEPVVLANTCGRGKVLTVLPVVEETVLGLTANRQARDRWSQWYDGALKELHA